MLAVLRTAVTVVCPRAAVSQVACPPALRGLSILSGRADALLDTPHSAISHTQRRKEEKPKVSASKVLLNMYHQHQLPLLPHAGVYGL